MSPKVLERIEEWWIGLTQPWWRGPYCGCGRPWESAVTTYTVKPATTTTYRCALGHEWTPPAASVAAISDSGGTQ